MRGGSLTRRPKWYRWLRLAAIAYGVCLLAGFAVRAFAPAAAAPYDGPTLALQAVDGGQRREAPVTVAFRDHPASRPSAPTVILLHGSPGHVQDFSRLVPALAGTWRVIVPDLPGFGRSERRVPDYSFTAHADYVLQLMDRLGVSSAHLVGFSMGGGVALSLADASPARVSSITLLSGLGVQEMELLGSYHANHVVHGAQLAVLLGVRYLWPRFSTSPQHGLTVEYARNFYDSDQRPLRAALLRLGAPTLIVHGTHDALVPYAAALEHYRLVPQSELVSLDESHFMLFTAQPRVAEVLTRFLSRVDRGVAIRREQASPERVVAAGAPFDPRHVPAAVGVTALVLGLGLIVGAWMSLEVTAVTAGLLVANGRASLGLVFVAGAIALAARTVAGPMVRRAWSSIAPRAWHACRQLAMAVLLGSAGWGLGRLIDGLDMLPRGLAAAAVTGVVANGLVPLTLIAGTHVGRRRLLGAWRRMTRWEFWPAWALYPPVALSVAALMVKHRSATVFTAANPAIPLGGFIGESKIDILRALEPSGRVARSALIPVDLTPEMRVQTARAFLSRHRIELPVVLKPNQGQRGSGVVVVKTQDQLDAYARQLAVDTILQEFVPGLEFGVFYYRLPGEARGHVLSITEKRMPQVVGDGRHTLEELILLDDRAVALAGRYLERLRARAEEVPRAGECIPLAEIGSHCRGAVFVDGQAALTRDLVEAFDRIARVFEGFYFGRFDVKAPSRQALAEGRDFTVIELNGVTSEATHIYDARYGVRQAWSVLRHQWRLAFEIGAENQRRGARSASIRELVQAMRDYRRQAVHHFVDGAPAPGLPFSRG